MDELVNASIICHQCMHLINSGIYIPGTKDTIIVYIKVCTVWLHKIRETLIFFPRLTKPGPTT